MNLFKVRFQDLYNETMSEQNDHLMNQLMIPAVFTPRECVKIIQTDGNFVTAGVASYGSYENTVGGQTRRSKKKAIAPSPANAWIFERIYHVVHQVNEEHYQFKIEDLESTQVLAYKPGDYFNWHVDLGAGVTSRRKLSIVVFLSRPEDYEGGQLMWVPTNKVFPNEQGSMVIFPSYLLHQVERVISGKRYTLVSWVIGPPFS